MEEILNVQYGTNTKTIAYLCDSSGCECSNSNPHIKLLMRSLPRERENMLKLKKKEPKVHVGFKLDLSLFERVQQKCKEENITVTEFFRYLAEKELGEE